MAVPGAAEVMATAAAMGAKAAWIAQMAYRATISAATLAATSSAAAPLSTGTVHLLVAAADSVQAMDVQGGIPRKPPRDGHGKQHGAAPSGRPECWWHADGGNCWSIAVEKEVDR